MHACMPASVAPWQLARTIISASHSTLLPVHPAHPSPSLLGPKNAEEHSIGTKQLLWGPSYLTAQELPTLTFLHRAVLRLYYYKLP